MAATQAYTSQGTQLQVSISSVFTTVPQAKGLMGPNVTWTIEDITTLSSPSNFKEKLPLMKDPGPVSFTLIYDSANAAIEYLRASNFAEFGVLEAFKIITSAPVPKTISFSAYVTKFNFKHESNKSAQIDVEITLSGPVSFA